MTNSKKSLTIVIPVYNERDRIHLAIDALNAYEPPEDIEIEKVVFVDDGSTDGTLRVLRGSEQKYPSEVVAYSPNRGRGYAVRAGMKEAETDYAMYLDADMSIPLENLQGFAPRMREGVDVLVGSKKMKETVCFQKRSVLRKVVGWGHSAIFSLVLGVRMRDFQGGFKVFSRRAVRNILSRARIERWGMDAEVIFLAVRKGYSMEEIPVRWGHVERGTKVSLARDISRALRELARIRWNHVCGRYGSASEPVTLKDVAVVYELQAG
jgi:dolichyl-phosphate beta-glucosyltransferase